MSDPIVCFIVRFRLFARILALREEVVALKFDWLAGGVLLTFLAGTGCHGVGTS
jgi:hypothetical protein